MPALISHSTDLDPAWLEATWILNEGEGLRARDATNPDPLLDAPTPFVESSATGSYSQLPVRVVGQGSGEVTAVPHALLRSRLTAASWLLAAGLSLLFLYQFATFHLTPRSLASATLVVTLGAAILLTGRRELSAPQLRLLELSIFGISGVQLFSTQMTWLTSAALERNPIDVTWAACQGVLAFAVLMLTYGMLMPNGWKRTAVMLIPPTMAPIGAIVFVRLTDSSVEATLGLDRVCELSAFMVGAYGISVFGTWTISNLRQDFRRAMRFGQYRLKKRIGRGGMGEVYLAEHRLLKRPCALKLIRVSHVQDPQSLIRFEREVRTTARLSHWNTVEIYDYGHTDDGTFYYVMEYLPGLNLSEMVQRFGAMSPDRVVHFLIQICNALTEAHAAGLIHRDLKPANIFASYRGGQYDVSKLLDFGLVVDDNRPEMLLTADPRQVGPFAGSPLYMSPEQASGDLPPDPRSDLYSLGATGYCLLTGHPPFEGKSPLRLMIAHARDPVTPPSRWEPGIPVDLEKVILRCLEKHPSRRYANVRELRDALLKCEVAGKWTQDRAIQWWKLRGPALMAADHDVEDQAEIDLTEFDLQAG